MQMSQSNMEKMLKAASSKLGIAPDELREYVIKGDVNSIMEKMNGKDAQKLKDALANPKVEEMLKNSPEMAKYVNCENKKD
jgi:hypothetical protein